MNKRLFLTNVLKATVVLSSGLLSFRNVMAVWNKSTMHEQNLNKAIKVIGGDKAITSNKIKIIAPEIAENGAVVPVEVDASALGQVKSIVFLLPNNPRVIGATFYLTKNAFGFVATRFKMAKSGDVIVIVKTNSKTYKTKKFIKVLVTGCG